MENIKYNSAQMQISTIISTQKEIIVMGTSICHFGIRKLSYNQLLGRRTNLLSSLMFRHPFQTTTTKIADIVA
jgi:hypothetical protein